MKPPVATTEAMPPPEPTLWESVRALPGPVWVVCIGTFVNKFGTFVVPFLTLYLTRRGFSLGDAGLALAGYGVGNVGASVLGGLLADRFGRRKTIVLSMVGGAAAMLLLSTAESLPALVAFSVFAGLAAELYRPAGTALIIDLTEPGQRVVAFATFRTCLNAGWAFGPATAGLLARYSYNYLFIGEAVTCLLYGAIAWSFLPKGVQGVQMGANLAQAFRVAVRDRVFLQMLASYLGVGFLLFQMSSTFGAHVLDVGFDERLYGILLGLNGVLVVIFELPLTRFTTRFRDRHVMAFGYLLFGVGFALFALPGGLVSVLVAGVVIFTLGEILSMPTASAYTAKLAPPDMRGRYMGIVGLMWSGSMVLAPVVGFHLYGLGGTVLWLACLVIGIATASLVARLP